MSMLHAGVLFGQTGAITEAAKAGASLTSAALNSAISAGSALHIAGEVLEHGSHSFVHQNGGRMGGVLKKGLKSASAFGMKGAIRTTQVGAGFAGQTLKTAGSAAAKAVNLGAETAAYAAPKMLHFSEEHGIHLSNWAGNRIAGAIGVGAAAMSIGAVANAQESNYRRDSEQEPRSQRQSEMHRNSLGAHGSMVTQGARSARKRY